jgi:hypothetical protein
MTSLNISKVAIGCASVDALRQRQQSRVADGIVPVFTRFRPKRADELIGGSLYWIVKHRVAARQTILGFGETAERRTIIHLDPALIQVRAQPRRAHQGWRYLTGEDAPEDFNGTSDGVDLLPPAMTAALLELALI